MIFLGGIAHGKDMPIADTVMAFSIPVQYSHVANRDARFPYHEYRRRKCLNAGKPIKFMIINASEDEQFWLVFEYLQRKEIEGVKA